MRKIIALIILLQLLSINCKSQSNNIKLSDDVKVTYKNLLDLRLQILAAQITDGSYSIIDMGRLGFPVSMHIDNQNKIVFKIDGNLNDSLSRATQKEIMIEGFLFVKTGIVEMISEDFPSLKFDCSKNVVGYWYLDNYHISYAKWKNGVFEWENSH